MHSKFLLFIPSLLILLSGCVSTKNTSVNMSLLKENKPSSITISARKTPSFAAMTAVNVQFGILGAAAQISSGNKIIKENTVEDPAIYIADELTKTLANQLEITNLKNGKQITDTTNVKALAEQYKDADLLVDVQTVNWHSIYYLSDWNNYRIFYSAKLRLIDTKKKTLIAESFCSKMQDDKANAPSYDQMIENKAAVLKAALKSHADACITEFKTKALGII